MRVITRSASHAGENLEDLRGEYDGSEEESKEEEEVSFFTSGLERSGMQRCIPEVFSASSILISPGDPAS
jgi:hypothetical protein